MTCIELMAACRARHREIRELEEKIQDARDAMTGMSQASGIRGGGGGDRFAAHAARVDELLGRLQAARRKLAAEEPAVILLTADMPAQPRSFLRAFYGRGEAPSAIARANQCTVSNVYKGLAAGRALAAKAGPAAVESALPACYMKGWEEEERC